MHIQKTREQEWKEVTDRQKQEPPPKKRCLGNKEKSYSHYHAIITPRHRRPFRQRTLPPTGRI